MFEKLTSRYNYNKKITKTKILKKLQKISIPFKIFVIYHMNANAKII